MPYIVNRTSAKKLTARKRAVIQKIGLDINDLPEDFCHTFYYMLEEFPAKERNVMFLYFSMGKNISEIAEIISMTKDKTIKILDKAYERLMKPDMQEILKSGIRAEHSHLTCNTLLAYQIDTYKEQIWHHEQIIEQYKDKLRDIEMFTGRKIPDDTENLIG